MRVIMVMAQRLAHSNDAEKSERAREEEVCVVTYRIGRSLLPRPEHDANGVCDGRPSSVFGPRYAQVLLQVRWCAAGGHDAACRSCGDYYCITTRVSDRLSSI